MTTSPRDGPTIHVLFRKEDLDPARLAGKTVVVVDILFATTSIIAALECGASVVHPARDPDEALDLSTRLGVRAPVLAGESHFQFIDGFVQPTPLALCRHVKPRDTLIYSTTNGTVALRACAGARRVLVGALINTGATVRALDLGRDDTVIILCAGTAGAFNMEDFYGAGCLVQRIAAQYPGGRMTDAALAALDYFEASDAGSVLRRSMVGRLMLEWELEAEVDFAARIDASEVAAELRDDLVLAL
ncbi:MAG: 2-phosphosulfolactate phosphatase [Gammaproteobacteria bacterium]|nr:2-phosphosulfolactate phosphatase [Gammaproteobacteria bacterium]